jgi:hypothetical protein
MSYLQAILKNIDQPSSCGGKAVYRRVETEVPTEVIIDDRSSLASNHTSDTEVDNKRSTIKSISTKSSSTKRNYSKKVRRVNHKFGKRESVRPHNSEKTKALFEAQTELINECMPSKDKITEIYNSIKYIINWTGERFYRDFTDNDTIEITRNHKVYQFSKKQFLSNRKFIYHLKSAFSKVMGDVWITIRPPQGKYTSHMILIKKNSRV